MDERIYLSPEELVARYKGKISEKTLANWRTKGGGPAFTKIGGKIMYPLCSVRKWEDGRTFESTAKRAADKIAAVLLSALTWALTIPA